MRELLIILLIAGGMALEGCQRCKTIRAEEDCLCTEEYAPVCGCDGKTYDNKCLAICQGVSYSDGDCGL